MIMSSTNLTKLHRHETTWCQWVWTHVLFRSSSSSYTRSMKKITNFLSFSQKVIMVLIMLELHEPHWVLVCLTPTPLLSKQLCMSFISSYSWSCSCCSHSYYFSKFKFLTFSKLAFLLLFHVLTTLSSSHSWCSPSSHSCCSSRLRSCYSFRSYSCCSKLVFLLFQAHILIALFSCVPIAPSSRSCFYFQSCSCCSKFTFKCCSS